MIFPLVLASRLSTLLTSCKAHFSFRALLFQLETSCGVGSNLSHASQSLMQSALSRYGAKVQKLSDMLKSGHDFITTGVPELDDLLGGGGVPCGQLVEVVGQTSSGKTQICHRVAANAALRGLGVWFIDAKNSFCPRRLLGFLGEKNTGKSARSQALADMPQIERDALCRVNVRRIFDVSALLQDLTCVRPPFFEVCKLGMRLPKLPLNCSIGIVFGCVFAVSCLNRAQRSVQQKIAIFKTLRVSQDSWLWTQYLHF